MGATDVDEILHSAASRHLAINETWLRLGHYVKRGLVVGGGFRSEISSQHFFVSPTGQNDPVAELEATVRAMFYPSGADTDGHAQCKFRARYLWLKKQFPENSNRWPESKCPSFSQWSLDGHVHSLSLVFATGYFKNPASYYGHILVKFNGDESVVGTRLLDKAVNFGAIIPANENPIVYILRGVFGGYDSAFTHSEFYKQNHDYGEIDLRDVWEYELNFSAEDNQFLIGHLWELVGVRFRYYFFKQNCAYRMAELLDLVGERGINNQRRPWAVPASVFFELNESQYRGQKLVNHVGYYPSRQSRFYQKYKSLSAEERATFVSVVDSGDADLTKRDNLSRAQKIAVVDALVDYYEYLIKQEYHTLESKRVKRDLLIKRIALGRAENDAAPPEPPPVHEGNRPSLLRLAAVTEAGDPLMRVQLRPAYYDLLGNDRGRLAYSALSMFDLVVDVADEKVTLNTLDLLNITTLNPTTTQLPGDKKLAWSVRVGAERAEIGCVNCLQAHLSGGLGKAFELNSSAALYGMIAGRWQSPYQDASQLSVELQLGGVSRVTEKAGVAAFFAERHYIDREDFARHDFIAAIEGRYSLGSQRELRMKYERQVKSSFSLSASWYW